MRFLLLVFLVCVCLSDASRFPRQILFGPCYDFSTSLSVNLTEWTNGKWYEIQRYWNEFERHSHCASQVFFLDKAKSQIDISISIRQENVTKFLQGRVNFNQTETEYSLDAIYPNDKAISSFDIVATDHDNYAIIYSCHLLSKDPSLLEKQERVWVLGRQKTLPAEVLDEVKTGLQTNNTDLTKYLYDVSQENCP